MVPARVLHRVVCVVACLPACMALAQSVAEPAFDVASVHLNTTSTDGHHHMYNNSSESHLRCVNDSLRALVLYAYGLPSSRVIGGPPWLDKTMFDIDAKSDPATDAALRAMSTADARRLKARMLQALLRDRFGLQVHWETRELPIYRMVQGNAGARFKPSQQGGTTIDVGSNHMHIAGSDNTLTLLADQLGQETGRVVTNETGLGGRFDFQLRWTPALAVAAGDEAPPDLFTALEEQLGLKLEPAKGPVSVLVVDTATQPTPN